MMRRLRRTYWTRRHSQLGRDAARTSRKLQLEIAELRAAPSRQRAQTRLTALTAGLTVMTSFAIFIGGIIVQQQIQANARTQLQADNYARLLRDFGTPNSAARIGAAHGLASYANSSGSQSGDVVEILIAHLLSENDPDVAKAVVKALVDVGDPAVEPLASANRTVAAEFARSAGEYIGLTAGGTRQTALSLGRVQSVGPTDPFVDPATKTPCAELTVHLAMVMRAFTITSGLTTGELERPQAVYHDFLSAPPLKAAFASGVATRRDFPGDNDAKTRGTLLAAVDRYALGLVSSSNALASVLHKKHATKDLHGVVLFAADLRGVDLDELDLDGAFMSGDARSASVQRASLKNAYLASLRANGANFSESTLDDAVLPDTWDSPPPIYDHTHLWKASRVVWNPAFIAAKYPTMPPSPAVITVTFGTPVPGRIESSRRPTPRPKPTVTPTPTPSAAHTSSPESSAPLATGTPTPSPTATPTSFPTPSPAASAIALATIAPPLSQEAWKTEVARRIGIEEGVRLEPYIDPVVGRSIGYALPLTAQGKSILTKARIPDPDGVIAGRVPLTQAQADATLRVMLEPAIAQARAALDSGVFDKMTDARRFTIVDMVYHLGAQTVAQASFRPKLTAATSQLGTERGAQRYYDEAADRMARYVYIGGQIAPSERTRAGRNAAMMRTGVWVDAFGDGSK